MNEKNLSAFIPLMSFIIKIEQFITSNLVDIQSSLSVSAKDLIDLAKAISSETEARREQSEKLMLDAHINPDQDVASNIKSSQNDVDKILNDAMNGNLSLEQSKNEIEEAKSRREGSKFSKSIEAIYKLETELMTLLLNLAGTLSEEDVIHQLLRNIRENFNVFGRFFEEYSKNLPASDEIAAAKIHELESRLLASCKSTHESMLFKKVFSSKDSNDHTRGQLYLMIQFKLKFAQFLKEQLSAIKDGYAFIIEQGMSMVYSINDTQKSSKKHADSIMIKQGQDHFENSSLKAFEDSESKLFEDMGPVKTATKVFDLPKELLNQVDAKVGEHLVDMMGALSVGDVISQRIDNVLKFNDAILKIAMHFSEDTANRLDLEKVNIMIESCLKYIQKHQVSAEERNFYKEVFKDFPSIKTAS